jgi:DNA-binding transcriptional LysR family regulator/pimeloyl-ACP methyl ester carboxylesterase/AraC-like DNA-binding protein
MDALDDILGSLRLSGGVVIDGAFTGDFCVVAQFTPEHFAPFFPEPETLISYHYVRSGQLIIQVEGSPPVNLDAGSIAILPRNTPHTLASRSGLSPADAGEIRRVTEEGVHHVSSGTDGPKAEVWCGFLGTSKRSDHPLLDALPTLLTLDAGGESEWLDSSMRFLARQQPSSEVVARLSELFLAQAIREYVDRLPAGAKGWLRGLADPAVSKALSVIHRRYSEELDIETLAREAGVSRSVLGERFVELLGEPPMRYCARWRMRVAANMLRDGKDNSANIAYAVGFSSEAAFNRAFKREYGVPPATWRRQLDAEATPTADAPSAPPAIRDERGTCGGQDGARLAFAVSGEGFPLVKAPNWMTHLDHDWTSPVYGHWLREGVRANRLVRADLRGFGLSEWEPARFDFEAMVDDLAAVIDAAKIDQCDLMAVSHGAPMAIAYAARNPERVRKLVLVNSFAAGWRVRADPEEIAWRESLLEMNRRQPSFRRSLLGEMFITLYFPSASQSLIEWHNEHYQQLGPVPNQLKMIELASWIDVRDELSKVRAETLVCHATQDGNAPLAAGRQVAEGIKGARFVELDSANHVLLGDEPAWAEFTREFRDFMGHPQGEAKKSSAAAPAQPRRDPRPDQLIVSGTPTAIHWITPRIGKFLDAHPEISLELDPSPRRVNFETETVDCAIRCGNDRPVGVHVEDLFTVDFTAACSPEFLARHPNLRTPADLVDVPRITPSDGWWSEVWRHFGVAPPNEAQRGVEMGAQMLDGIAAMRGQGVALLTPLFWSEELAEGRLVCPFPDRIDGKGDYWLVYPEERKDWPKIRAFSEWLRGLCAEAEESTKAIA